MSDRVGASVWAENLHEELAFWRSWFEEERFREGREARRAALSRGFAPTIESELALQPGEQLRVLDVGSGPLSTLPTSAPRNPVELVCLDALAREYNELLAEFSYDECPRIRWGVGEALVDLFGEDSFHYVNIANALDHCKDPAETFVQMYRVCRPGGKIVVVSVENEGEREGYAGLHQWNLEASDAGIRLWNSVVDRNLLDAIPSAHTYSWSAERRDSSFTVFVATIGKQRA